MNSDNRKNLFIGLFSVMSLAIAGAFVATPSVRAQFGTDQQQDGQVGQQQQQQQPGQQDGQFGQEQQDGQFGQQQQQDNDQQWAQDEDEGVRALW
ncbi:hypothetical protein H6G20_17095 [Desertifilum sp. FACHB-1129]|uniref:Uncharacterized protein n=1 Tax=Desertifilum tharense IPPAS B-1220 TaxID=1781255 RepID=A0A1E5QMI0_9CYAN|nr:MULTISPECIES: hypothetical protein [Desertifilum]MDA0212775.1 hypothetical protein [Cyanobacteria bacterium FC1]MBD2313387.1 hypothetical protein [Desertifilum sp. FACHB-1129]MBD2324458.1 hypothetical protein [Desertifilum sp. FACHB-866]MBD2334472.1 hypothetical protein [Desertifilum sp. FACHB-868]OEJ75902.1 hypothetical protein BH720_07305 [Desertifilum tharense IPPAS B-1220]